MLLQDWTGPAEVPKNSQTADTMLATQQRMLTNSRLSAQQHRPFVAARSRVQPTIVAKAGLAPLVESFKADQLRTDLPQVRNWVNVLR